ncbi:leucine-zipper of insertion element IS481 [Nakamurella panacisegetis]|uniref:Leucine-zipper of insertion element IS481 n=1 Tax=Nakamurella panacisegetis TaxID=1090615 RepID=A0A1H0RLD0_9ACTN|nr:leucine-zipper of insertion element IS481 [Nakamurella panacisegetis]
MGEGPLVWCEATKQYTRTTQETLVSHRNAPLTAEGRRRLCERVDSGRPICHVAAEAGIARQTLAKWHARWRECGLDGLHDRSSRPASCPGQTDPQIEDLVEYLRRSMKLGPVMLTAELAEFGITMHAWTVHRILVRRGVSRLADLDVTGADLRQQPKNRYEHPLAGDLVHLDVKKVGRIPDGGWWAHGRGSVGHKKSQRRPRIGYCYLHTAIDDHSRLAYTEALDDEKAVTAVGFWLRAKAFFAAHGIETIRRVLSDNGSCYRSRIFNAALADDAITHKYTRPYRPQTNGKVERFNRTLAQECLYARAWNNDQERIAAIPGFLHRYNYHRPHTALRGLPPIRRTQVVTNLSGFNI